MDNNSILIDRYLQNEMSADEKTSFEEKLKSDKNLQEEFNIQKQIIKAAENAGLKNEFAKAIKKRIITKQLIRWGIIAAIGIAAFIFYAVKTGLFSHNEKGEKSIAAKDSPAPEKFDIDNANYGNLFICDILPEQTLKFKNGDGYFVRIPFGLWLVELDVLAMIKR